MRKNKKSVLEKNPKIIGGTEFITFNSMSIPFFFGLFSLMTWFLISWMGLTTTGLILLGFFLGTSITVLCMVE